MGNRKSAGRLLKAENEMESHIHLDEVMCWKEGSQWHRWSAVTDSRHHLLRWGGGKGKSNLEKFLSVLETH